MRRKAMHVAVVAVVAGTLIAWGPSALADKKSARDKKVAATTQARVVSAAR
jgi:hypothetical protein